MESTFKIQIDSKFSSDNFSCLEYPEFIYDDKSSQYMNKISHVQSNDGIKFIYKPIINCSERLKITSNTQKRNIILLKIKKSSSGTIQSASFIGITQKYHVFRELFDFTAESEYEILLQKSLKNAADNFNEAEISKISESVSNTEIDWNTFCIPPYKFSHIALPLSTKDIRSNLKLSQKDESSNHEKSMSIPFFEPKIPIEPSDDAIFKAKNIPQAHIEAVAKIFDERPIVSKIYLRQKLKDPSIITNLRQILPILAYHWKNGPWHLLWTKYGIDPRKDPKYRFFQSIELRNKMFAKELKRGKSVTTKSQDCNPAISGDSNKRSSSYCFDGETLILSYLTYQYADLTYLPLQEIVNYPGDIRSVVSENEGWYPDGTTKKIRDIMKLRWFELLRNMDLSSLPQNKLEEILEITAPGTSISAIGADWNSLSKSSHNDEEILDSEGDENDFNEEKEESDYEIFDY